ncbi:MAG: hypothetical protein AAF492_32130, partial [Verrucomicrobiota bacterium]
MPKNSKPWKEGYTPSLDPVRVEGTWRIDSVEEAWPRDDAPKMKSFKPGEVQLIKDGLKKADTPAWIQKPPGRGKQSGLLFTDLEREELYFFTPPDGVETIRKGASRGKTGPDRRFYGVFDGKLASWRPGEKAPRTIIEEAAGGRDISLNDIAVSSRGRIYFTTLKDPDKGRLSMIDP